VSLIVDKDEWGDEETVWLLLALLIVQVPFLGATMFFAARASAGEPIRQRKPSYASSSESTSLHYHPATSKDSRPKRPSLDDRSGFAGEPKWLEHVRSENTSHYHPYGSGY